MPIISKSGQLLKPAFDDGTSSTVQIESLCELLGVGQGSHYKGKSRAKENFQRGVLTWTLASGIWSFFRCHDPMTWLLFIQFMLLELGILMAFKG